MLTWYGYATRARGVRYQCSTRNFTQTEESLVMKPYLYIAAIVCLVIAILSPIGSNKVFSQDARPPTAEKALNLPAGYTIPPQDKPCILPGNKVDIQCLILNDPDFVRIRAEEAGLEAQALVA